MIVLVPLRALVLALALGAACSFAVACGEERKGLISATRAEEIKANLDNVGDDVAAAKCSALTDHLEALRRDINDLPGSVDRDLRERLREGLANLEAQAPEECSASTQTTETEPETTPETVPPETVPETVPPETTPETVPPETTPTTPPETTPTTPQTPTTQTPTTPSDGGGGTEAPTGAVQTP